MNIRLRFTAFLLSGIAQVAALAQTTVHIALSQRRPLEAALSQLENQIGIPVNYEDPRFECADDIEDVTTQVQNAAQKAAHPNVRIIVPKGGSLSLDLLLPSVPQAADALVAVTQLRQQHEASGYPGRFSVKAVRSVITVEPNAVRKSDCTWSETSPVMEMAISFPPQVRDATETLTLILNTLAQQIGVKIGLANLPVLSFVNRSVTLGANSEPANAVLVRLFEQLSIPGPSSNFSYHLFFDPGLKYYLAGIAEVSPVRAQTPESVPPHPAPVGSFGSSSIKK
jgi:hypothetical protein